MRVASSALAEQQWHTIYKEFWHIVLTKGEKLAQRVVHLEKSEEWEGNPRQPTRESALMKGASMGELHREQRIFEQAIY